jgi:hypothetical protein
VHLPHILLDRGIYYDTDRLDKYWAGFTNTPKKTKDNTYTIIDPDRIMSKFVQLDKIVYLTPQIRPDSVRWFLTTDILYGIFCPKNTHTGYHCFPQLRNTRFFGVHY